MIYAEFLLLAAVEEKGKFSSQRELAAITGQSIGTVNRVLNSLKRTGYIKENTISEDGLQALEPYRVKQAIFIAAGMGERLIPITLNTPKPLVRIKGERIIDSLLDAVTTVGIKDIYIVRGYLADQFDQLLYKYPHIKFIENTLYNESNNISSMMLTRHLTQSTYVFDADLLLYNPALVTKYQYRSNYLAVPKAVTDDWCLASKNGYITKMMLGGTNTHQMLGFSYWAKKDRQRLISHLESVYNSPGGKECFWDEVAICYYPNEYKIYIRECSGEDVKEIDTLRELQGLDPAYGLL